MIFPEDLIYCLLAAAATFLIGFVIYYKQSFTYWKKRGLEYLEPTIPFGNTGALFTSKLSFGEQFAEFYKQFKSKGLKHGGVFMFARPFYVPVDPAIIKDILQKNFSHFVNRGLYVDEATDPLSGHLFSLEDNKWRNLRVKLTSTFTSGKMKMMFDTMAKCAQGLNILMDKASSENGDVEFKEVFARFTTDVISSCAFGIESNSLKDPNTDFRHYGKRVVNNNIWENLRNLCQFLLPRQILSIVKFRTTKSDVEQFFTNVVQETVDYREKNNVYRKDFLHLLLQLKNRGKISDDEKIFNDETGNAEVGLTINEMAAQVFVFFIAGFETSSIALTFSFYELARNQTVQDKLRNEIEDILQKHNNQISYEAIMEMTYMDQVINETLRKYPSLPHLNRKCTKPYDIPNANIQLEEGTMVVIPLLGLQYDPEYYPNPDKFDPERFNPNNKNSRPGFTWLPFGEGPRICIGMRFGLLQIKLGLATLLRNYKVQLSPKTKTPKIDPKCFTIGIDNGIWLKMEKLNNNP